MSTDASQRESIQRGINRRTEFMKQSATFIQSTEQYLDVLSKSEKKLILRFLRNPVALLPHKANAT